MAPADQRIFTSPLSQQHKNLFLIVVLIIRASFHPSFSPLLLLSLSLSPIKPNYTFLYLTPFSWPVKGREEEGRGGARKWELPLSLASCSEKNKREIFRGIILSPPFLPLPNLRKMKKNGPAGPNMQSHLLFLLYFVSPPVFLGENRGTPGGGRTGQEQARYGKKILLRLIFRRLLSFLLYF